MSILHWAARSGSAPPPRAAQIRSLSVKAFQKVWANVFSSPPASLLLPELVSFLQPTSSSPISIFPLDWAISSASVFPHRRFSFCATTLLGSEILLIRRWMFGVRRSAFSSLLFPPEFPSASRATSASPSESELATFSFSSSSGSAICVATATPARPLCGSRAAFVLLHRSAARTRSRRQECRSSKSERDVAPLPRSVTDATRSSTREKIRAQKIYAGCGNASAESGGIFRSCTRRTIAFNFPPNKISRHVRYIHVSSTTIEASAR
ncbi:MAG: hypothetical protein QOG48_714 [Verrucomicrobiota bacterium]